MGAEAECDRSRLPLVMSCCHAGTRGSTPSHEESFVRFLTAEEQRLPWWQVRHGLSLDVSFGTWITSSQRAFLSGFGDVVNERLNMAPSCLLG